MRPGAKRGGSRIPRSAGQFGECHGSAARCPASPSDATEPVGPEADRPGGVDGRVALECSSEISAKARGVVRL